MGSNYCRIDGVTVQRWSEDGDEPEESHEHASVEEMYYYPSSGTLDITIVLDDGGLYSITIPVVAKKSWNSFVESLPAWDVP